LHAEERSSASKRCRKAVVISIGRRLTMTKEEHAEISE